MKVAIIVLNWNQPETTHECVDSLRNIEYRDHVIIVVDNGSDIEKYNKLLSLIEENESIKIVRSEKNLLYAGGNNFGYEYAKRFNPDYVLFLNNDTIVDRQFLRRLVDFMDKHNDVGVVGPKIYYSEKPDTIWHAGGYVNFLTGKIAHYGLREKDDSRWNVAREVDYVSGCALFIRRQVFDRIGGFDESFGIYTEDVDLCFRVKKMGYKVVYVSDSIIWHKLSISSGGNVSFFKIWNKFKSNIKFFLRHCPYYMLLITITMYLVTSAVALLILKLGFKPER